MRWSLGTDEWITIFHSPNWNSFIFSGIGFILGLIFDTTDCGEDGTSLILSDIIGFKNDMDLKVAGNEKGVTAFQMDLKLPTGIKMPILKQAAFSISATLGHNA